MKVHTSALVALLQLAGLGTGALAETPSGGQIAAGRKFAQMVCGARHVVVQQRDEPPVPSPPGPSFAVLAQRPSLTEASRREFLGSEHRNMGPAQAMPNRRLADWTIRSTESSRS